MKSFSPSLSALAFAVASALSSFAIAQTPPTPTPAPVPTAPVGPKPEVGPRPRSLIGAKCKDEIAKLCAAVEPGRGALARCLRAHEADLGESCKNALTAARGGAGAPAPAAAPAPTAAPTPAGAAPAAAPGAPGAGKGHGHGRPGAMGDGPGWGPMKEVQKSCQADKEKFCKDVQPGHGRVAVCLNEHVNDLSAPCKNVVTKVAEHMNAPMEMHADCAADAQKLCSDVPAGMGRVGMCLGEHSAELSPACKKHVDEMKAHWGKHGPAGGPGHGPHAGHAGGAGGAPGTPLPPPSTPPPH